MSKEERAEQAAQLKAIGMCNCCQAVLMSLADQCGLSPEQLMTLGSGYAVGMGNMEATCGALIGAVMAAGLKLQGQGTLRFARQLSDQFRKSCGATICKELKGKETGVALCSCEDCVRNAVRAYADLISLS